MAARPKPVTQRGLAEYRRRRRFGQTPEPPPGRRQARKAQDAPSFVVQLHHARQRHFDFRLEIGGALHSWAIPKGPSLDPAQKRLAVEVEDHPLEYGSFEGEIPQGHYGAGTVAIWDRGYWEPEDDPKRALQKGRLAFTLHGERLQGRWTLVRTGSKAAVRARQPQWLLIKGRDEWAQSGDVADDTPLSQALGGTESAHALIDLPGPADLQLARLEQRAPRGEDWLHEVKYDGYRLLMQRSGPSVKLLSRNGLDWTDRLQHIAAAVRALPCNSAVLDGELVAVSEDGRSDFSRLQQQMSSGGRLELSLAFAFDLLHLDGRDLRKLPLERRKQALASLLAESEPALQLGEHLVGHGEEAHAAACAQGLEGVISKARKDPYRAGRIGSWLKLKCAASDEFAIVGYSPGKGARAALGALLLARPERDGWRYVGRCGSGLDDGTIRTLLAQLERRERPVVLARAPTHAELRGARPVWVEPRLVVEVQHRGITADGLLRQASFKGLRPDKTVVELRGTGDKVVPVGASSLAPGTHEAPSAVKISNPDRLLFTKPAVTKQDLADFYGDLAEPLLRGIRRRPISLLRCPDGIAGECFFQRHLSRGFPDAIRETSVPSARGGTRKIIYVEDREGLLALVQMGVIEIHAWGATIDDIDRPDQVVFDLDPGIGVAWRRVVGAARALRERLQSVGLESVVRTSGGKGLHVVVPLTPKADWPTVKSFSQAVARTFAAERPDEFVAVAGERNRKNRIFIDYLRNSRSASSIASYSLRARPGAPAAVPLAWAELGRLRSAAQYGYTNLRQRIRRLQDDPWATFAGTRQTLPED